MSVGARVAGAVAGVLGLAAAGAAVGVATKQREIASRTTRPHLAYGSLRSEPMRVVTEDGVDLYVEVDEVVPGQELPGTEGLTLVFAHGFALNLDCWHEQRAHFRGRVRSVYFDQRSHGRSTRSPAEHCRIPQLGRDLRRVIGTTTDGPVVVVAHSMGGMGVISMLEQYPDLLGETVTGVGLISTTAGDLSPATVLLPLLPPVAGGRMITPVVRVLERLGGTVDTVRSWGKDIASVVTDSWSFGGPVPADLVEFCARMIEDTPFAVVADFYASFEELDLFSTIGALGRVPTTIVCGTKDRITKTSQARKMHAGISRSDLVEVENAGHLALLERPDEVNAALDELLDRAVQFIEQHPEHNAR